MWLANCLAWCLLSVALMSTCGSGWLVIILPACVSYLIFCALIGKVLVTPGPLPFILNMNSVS